MMVGLSTVVTLADDKVDIDLDKVVTLTYTPAEYDRLPQQVKEVLALGFPCFVVNSIEAKQLNQHKTIYKVVLSDPENFETVVYITNKGEILG